jgi:hypothetical protein
MLCGGEMMGFASLSPSYKLPKALRTDLGGKV